MTVTVPILLRVLRPMLPGRAHSSTTVVRLRGELDFLDVPALQACLSDLRWPGRPRNIIDLTELEYIDCACLSVLARHARDIRAQRGTVELVGSHGAVRRILAVTGLLLDFEVHDAEGQAAGAGVRRTVIFPLAGGQQSPILTGPIGIAGALPGASGHRGNPGGQ
jgi:anti-anti-sigma factor